MRNKDIVDSVAPAVIAAVRAGCPSFEAAARHCGAQYRTWSPQWKPYLPALQQARGEFLAELDATIKRLRASYGRNQRDEVFLALVSEGCPAARAARILNMRIHGGHERLLGGGHKEAFEARWKAVADAVLKGVSHGNN